MTSFYSDPSAWPEYRSLLDSIWSTTDDTLEFEMRLQILQEEFKKKAPRGVFLEVSLSQDKLESDVKVIVDGSDTYATVTFNSPQHWRRYDHFSEGTEVIFKATSVAKWKDQTDGRLMFNFELNLQASLPSCAIRGLISKKFPNNTVEVQLHSPLIIIRQKEFYKLFLRNEISEDVQILVAARVHCENLLSLNSKQKTAF